MIYFAQAPIGGLIKIGTTIRLSVRLTQLQAEYGPLTILGVCDGGYLEESVLHQRFCHLRTQGEWFLPGTDLLHFIQQNGRDWGGEDEVPLSTITFWVPVELRAAADAYRDAQRFPPDLTAILRQALQDFLEREGYWPPPPADPS